MGNQQQGGTSRHFINHSPAGDDQPQKRNSVLWTKNGRIPISKEQPTKASWQLARDASMDMLSRKTTKLNFKQGPTPNLLRHRRSTLKKYSLHPPPPPPGKPILTYQVPRMPTDKEVAEIAIAYQLLCEFCGKSCVGEYARCRICINTYHIQCLFERGHINDQSFSLPRLSRQDWSCPDCRDLTRLLTQEEINYLIYVFDQIDRNKDGYIILENFLEYCSNGKIADNYNLFPSNDDELEKSHFHLMDSRQTGAVAWWDFALFYSCKLIARKNRTFLTTKLSTKELVFAKNLFFKDPKVSVDNESNIIITKDHFNRVCYDLILMIKKKYGGNFIDAVLYENQTIDETIEKLSVIGWDEFVRQISVSILLNRSNYDVKNSQPHRISLPYLHRSKTNLISQVNNTIPSVTISPDLLVDQSFRKHAKILQKLNERDQQEELRRKQIGSLVDWSIVEDIEEENNFQIPKLKTDARDQRQTVSEPWSVVKDMQQLRNQPILVTTTRYQMLKV